MAWPPEDLVIEPSGRRRGPSRYRVTVTPAGPGREGASVRLRKLLAVRDAATGAVTWRESRACYDVSLTADGPVCDCPDFLYAREGLDPMGCKHVRACLLQGLFGPGTGPGP